MIRRVRMRVCRMLAEVAGRRVLLTPEQGHGDMIQFARYAPLLAAHGARVIVQTYAELTALMRTLDGVERVVALGETEPPADIVTPLLSLPLVFGTRLDTVPAQVPYLRAPAGAAGGWQRRLGPRTRPRVGLAGGVRSTFPSDRCRSKRCCPCCRCRGIEMHALQKEIPTAQRDWLAMHAGC